MAIIRSACDDAYELNSTRPEPATIEENQANGGCEGAHRVSQIGVFPQRVEGDRVRRQETNVYRFEL